MIEGRNLNPTLMPIDRKRWAQQLNLCNFINAYYQYEDVHCCGDVKKILIIYWIKMIKDSIKYLMQVKMILTNT
jgi:hypothetical protein